MTAVLADDRFPAFNRLGSGRIVKGVHQRLTIHVTSGRQAEVVQDRRGDVENAGSIDALAGADTGSAEGEDPEIAMLVRRSGGLCREVLREQVIGMKPVIAQDHHAAIGPGNWRRRPSMRS